MASVSGWVYLISFVPYKGDYRQKCYKIGFSAAPEERLRQLNVVPGYFQLEHTIKTNGPEAIEKLWHELFENSRIPGTNEWFDLDQEQVEEFLAVDEMQFTPDGLDKTESHRPHRKRECSTASLHSNNNSFFGPYG